MRSQVIHATHALISTQVPTHAHTHMHTRTHAHTQDQELKDELEGLVKSHGSELSAHYLLRDGGGIAVLGKEETVCMACVGDAIAVFQG